MGLRGARLFAYFGSAFDRVFWYFNSTSCSGCRGYEKL